MADLSINRNIEKAIGLVESVLSVVLFSGMFGAIIIQVFFRYVLKAPLVWPYELSIYCFIYIIFIGAAIAARRDTHIAFSLYHDSLSVRGRLLTRVITNICAIILLIIIMPSSFSFIRLMSGVRSSSLDIPMYVLLSSFPVGISLIILYLSLWTSSYIKTLKSMGGG